MQTFDYTQVASKMEALNTVFTNFANKLTQIDTLLNENVGKGADSALNGIRAKALLESWNAYSDTFSDFKNEFDSLYAGVQQVAKNNASLEAEAKSLFSESGFKADVSTNTTNDYYSTRV